MPSIKDKPYPKPGKTPENTPAPPRAPRVEIAKAASIINREMYRLELTSMDKFDERQACTLRQTFKETVRRLGDIRLQRFEDGRYEEFEQA